MCDQSFVQFYACDAGQCTYPGGMAGLLSTFFPDSAMGDMPWKGDVEPDGKGGIKYGQ
jgi:hypothetical protein